MDYKVKDIAQADYIGVSTTGPFKVDTYRY